MGRGSLGEVLPGDVRARFVAASADAAEPQADLHDKPVDRQKAEVMIDDFGDSTAVT
jgi:hypothetical protein